MGTKRQVPSLLQKILAFDVYMSNVFCTWANQFLPLRSLRIHYKFLEVSCHGIPWLAGWLAFIFLWDSVSLYQLQVNVYIGLLLDIILVAVIKAATRRRRPAANQPDMLGAVGPDKFSFPSGHASRAVMITCLLLWNNALPILFIPPLLAWASSVCMSRLLMQRHHILDVIAGVLLGMSVAWFVCSVVWLSQETSSWLISWIMDERKDGGSYHV